MRKKTNSYNLPAPLLGSDRPTAYSPTSSELNPNEKTARTSEAC